MNVLFTRVALEELSFYGNSGCSVDELFDRVYTRISNELYLNYLPVLKNAHSKRIIIENLLKHPNIVKVGIEDQIKCDSDFFLSKLQEYKDLRLISNNNLQKHILNLNIYSNVPEVEGRLAVYMTIASKGFEGCWQYEISKILKMDPKMVFQHLKSLYKYDIIVRFSIPMPTNHKKKLFSCEESTSTLGGHVSAVIWLSSFFDFSRIPRELSQLIWCQHIQPLSTEIVRILKYKAPGKIAWEKDIRALCAGFLILHDENSADHLICSQRTANKVFNKVRDALLMNDVRRVFAWNPATNSYAPCLCLKDAFPQSEIEVFKDQIVKTDVNVSNLNELSDFSGKSTNFILDPDLELVGNAFSELNEEESNDYFFGRKLFEITETDQVLWLIRASGCIGIVSLDIVKLLGVNMKRLGKLLTDLHRLECITKIPHRYNRTFMYRYYYVDSKLNNKITISSNIVEEKKLETSVQILKESNRTIIIDLFNETFPGKEINLSSVTEQFVRRLIMAKKWIEEFGCLTIPELTKLCSDNEGTPKGPDRKTIKRILYKLLELDNSIKETSVNSEKSKTQSFSGDVAIFFSSKTYSEEQARTLKATELKNKRSNTTKSAIERRKKELSHVVAIVNASTAINPIISSKEKPEKFFLEDPNNELNSYKQISESEQNIANLTPKLITFKEGDTTVIVNTPNFTVASLNIEIDEKLKNQEYPSNFTDSSEISKLNVPGTSSSVKSSNKFDPSKRMNLGFSRISSGGIKMYSSKNNIGFLSFSQKILAHYGFVFPLMIRLKLLHEHILCLATEYNSISELFSNRQILDEMEIDHFLRIIGFGHRSSFIEEYLISGAEKTSEFGSKTRMKELPSNIYETLTRIHSKRTFPNKPQKHHKDQIELKGRKATVILFRLLSLLSKLGILVFNTKKQQKKSNKIHSNSQELTIDSVSVSNPSFKVNFEIKIPLILSSSEEFKNELIKAIGHQDKVYNLRNKNEFDCFWTRLQIEAMETQKFILNSRIKDYSVILPDILLKRHWKSNPLLSLKKRNYLENYARKLMFETRSEKSCENDKNDNSPIVLSLASPEIKTISDELSITPLVTLRYLLRVVDSISLEEGRFVMNGEKINKKISFHPIRDPRYQCHICYALYSTHPAIISHYKLIHNISTISNSAMYTINKSTHSSVKNKNLNLNAILKTQIISESSIPFSLKHLIDDKTQGETEDISENEKILLLRSFLRLSKDDLIILYLMLYINQKAIFKIGRYKIDLYENLTKIFSLFKEKNIENNFSSLQFSRIKSLIQDKIGTTHSKFKTAINFLFSCLKTIYPLNSKLLDTLDTKERQRICWQDRIQDHFFLNKWRQFLIEVDTSYVKNSPLNAKNLNATSEKTETEFMNYETSNFQIYLKNFCFEDCLLINTFKSGFLSSKSLIENVDLEYIINDLGESKINNYLEYCIKYNILKLSHRQSDFKIISSKVSGLFFTKLILSKRILLNCFGKTLLWREIFDLCSADLKMYFSNSKNIMLKPSTLTGCSALNHLNNLLENKCDFEIEWNDENFYERITNKTDEDLFRLLNETIEANSEEEVEILDEFNCEYPAKSFDNLREIDNFSENFKYKKLKSENVQQDSLICNKDIEVIQEKKTDPIISKIVAKYTEYTLNSDSEYLELFKDNPFNFQIPFAGTNDSDPIEFCNVSSHFSIKGTILNYNQEKTETLKRKISLDPMVSIIKNFINLMNSKTEDQKLLLNVIISIIDFINNSKSGCSIQEIEEFIFCEYKGNFRILKNIDPKINDSSIEIYNFKLPVVYYLVFFLEFLRMCIRIPIHGKWVYFLYNFSNGSFNLKSEDFSFQSKELSIPINIPIRIWLLWSAESKEQIISKDEIKFIYNIVNKSLPKNNNERKLSSIRSEKKYEQRFLNSFLSIDGQINRSVCGLLIYYICYLIHKSPITNLSKFISCFSFFSYCEVELFVESLFGENCIYKNGTNIIFSKPIPSILRIFEAIP